MTGSEASSSENSSPCSTGPSSQGPASPQGELVSPAIDGKAQTGGGVATAAAVVMDMTMDNNRKMAGAAGFVYPYATAYCLAPPALYASGKFLNSIHYAIRFAFLSSTPAILVIFISVFFLFNFFFSFFLIIKPIRQILPQTPSMPHTLVRLNYFIPFDGL